MHHGSGMLLASPFAVIALSGYVDSGLHHILLAVSIIFAVVVLISGIVRRGLELRGR